MSVYGHRKRYQLREFWPSIMGSTVAARLVTRRVSDILGQRGRGDDHGGPEGDHTPGVFLNRKSMREVARKLHHGRAVIRKALYDPGIPVYKRSVPAPKRTIGPFVEAIQQWLQEDKQPH